MLNKLRYSEMENKFFGAVLAIYWIDRRCYAMGEILY